MSTIVLDDDVVHIPAWVRDLDSFRRWVDADDFPDSGRICYFKGEVWVDMSKEQIFTHVQVKGEFNIVVGGMVKLKRRGRYSANGVLLTNDDVDIATKPDGTFVSTESLRSGKVRLVPGKDEGFVELAGSPDMVLEVISKASVKKDTQLLREFYWQAGISEYWLVDVRRAPIHFDILLHNPRGYVPVRKQAGWVKSSVFGNAFRLTQQTGPDGHPEYTLAMRDS